VLSRANRSALATLLDVLRDAAEGDRLALAWHAADGSVERVSRAAFRERVARAAGRLADLGIGPRDVVVIAQADGLDGVYAFWAALQLGAVPSMLPPLTEKLDPASWRASMALLVEHSQARLVLTTPALAPELARAVACPTASFEGLGSGPARALPEADPDPDAVAFLQHSSGTTGLQKGVALSHRAVLNQLASYATALRLETEDVVVSWLPLYHDMGLIAGFLMPLVQGIPLVLLSPLDWVRSPGLLVRAIDTHRGTLCWLPNFAYSHMARRVRERDLPGVSLAGVRAFVNCSEPVRDASQQAFLERFAGVGVRPEQLAACYAMAENVFAVTQTPPGRAPRLHEGHVSCGSPVPGVEVRIGPGGEIQLRSDCMLSGYHRRPELDAAAFEDGWYRTGDLGYLADGELYVVGRQKDLIINGGKNLHPHDLEDVVNGVAGVHPGRAVAFGVADADEGTELIAVVAETAATTEAEERVITAAIRQAFVARVGVAASYVRLVPPGWLVKTSSGKLARDANRRKWLAERG
jgi:acyl-CoA synthetase (AMP-forming)/AMP-acid ligase II